MKCGRQCFPSSPNYVILLGSPLFVKSGLKQERRCGMTEICELCKALNNPLRIEILLRTYATQDGMNVGVLAGEMLRFGLCLSGVSQYLRQFERLGVIRRERAGRYVNYLPDARSASPRVRNAVEAIVKASKSSNVKACIPAFAALMNPFRARVVAAVAHAGSISAVEICEKTNHSRKHLVRDLRAALDAGLLTVDDSDVDFATYRYVQSSDPIVRLLVAALS